MRQVSLKRVPGHESTGDHYSPIKRYIEKRLDQGLSNATINRELAAIKRALISVSDARHRKLLSVPYIPMLKENNVRKGFIEHEDYLALRENTSRSS